MFNNGYNFSPYQTYGTKQGLFSLFKGKFNWSSFLNNTQKTLNIINQAIPVFYQIKPVWNNTKTIFKIMGALKDEDNSKQNNIKKSYNNNSNVSTSNYNNNQNTSTKSNYLNDNTPNFFL